jgi:hypothetical protein
MFLKYAIVRPLLMRSSTARLSIILAMLVLGTGLAACTGWAPDGRVSGAGSGHRNRSDNVTGGDCLVVQQNNRVLRCFTLPQLQDLPQLEVVTPQSHGAVLQKGPTVRSILDAAQATGVSSVRVDGSDRARTLTAAELTDQIILNITKRNTLKLTGTTLSVDRWVRDVTSLVVNP